MVCNMRHHTDVHYYDLKQNIGKVSLMINPLLMLQHWDIRDTRYMVKKVHDKFVIHNSGSPAVILNYHDENKKFLFFNNGYNVRIEDLPIDDILKCALLLKYSKSTSGDQRYCWYE